MYAVQAKFAVPWLNQNNFAQYCGSNALHQVYCLIELIDIRNVKLTVDPKTGVQALPRKAEFLLDMSRKDYVKEAFKGEDHL